MGATTSFWCSYACWFVSLFLMSDWRRGLGCSIQVCVTSTVTVGYFETSGHEESILQNLCTLVSLPDTWRFVTCEWLTHWIITDAIKARILQLAPNFNEVANFRPNNLAASTQRFGRFDTEKTDKQIFNQQLACFTSHFNIKFWLLFLT